jgi:hypothetical protein
LERQKVIASSLSALQAQATDSDINRSGSNSAALAAAAAAAAPPPSPAPASGVVATLTRAVSSVFGGGSSAAPASPAPVTKSTSNSGAAAGRGSGTLSSTIHTLIEQTQLTDLKELPPAASASIPHATPVPASRLESTIQKVASDVTKHKARMLCPPFLPYGLLSLSLRYLTEFET